MRFSLTMPARVPRDSDALRIFQPPTPLRVACGQVEAWLKSPRVMLLSETYGYRTHGKRWKREKFKALSSMMPVWPLFTGIMAFKRYGPHIVTSADFPPFLRTTHWCDKNREYRWQHLMRESWINKIFWITKKCS